MPFGPYVKHGWVLCSIARGSKGPLTAGWNLRVNGITDAEVAECLDGAGLMHAYSGTCAIDVDDMPKAIEWCAARGVDLPALFAAPDSVQISSGKKGHGKLLYALPVPMRGKQVSIDKQATIDFRCATATDASQQDVLPPSMHPETLKPYGWLLGDPLVADWTALPPLPAALRAAWEGLLTKPAPEPKAASTTPPLGLEAVQAILATADPDADRETWLKLLAAVHHETGGSAAGLDLADAWSARGKKYVGRADVETRWRSFNPNHPNPVTLASFLGETPVDESEFTSVVEAPPAPDTRQSQEQKANAKRELESRLVYVRTVDRYFDKETRDVLASDHAIAHRFSPLMPKVRGSRLDPVKLLKESPLRRSVDAVGFHPGEGAIFTANGDNYANYYRPRIALPLEPTARERDTLDWLFNRIGDTTFQAWLIQFLAHVIQRPGIKIFSAPLIWSEIYGNGKSTFLRVIPSLLVGAEYSEEVPGTLLESNFNDYLARAWHVNLTEFRAVTAAGRRDIAAKLRPWIAEGSVSIHPKGLPAYTIPNRFFLTATSNDADATPLEEGDRRWGVYEMKAPRMTESEGTALYTDFLHTERAAGVLRHFFLNQSLTGFNPAAGPPNTKARTEMIEASTAPDVELLRTAFEECKGPFVRDVCTNEDVQNYVFQHLKYRPGAARVGRLMRGHPFDGRNRVVRAGGGSFRVWIIRNQDTWATTSERQIANYLMNDEINSLPIDPLAM